MTTTSRVSTVRPVEIVVQAIEALRQHRVRTGLSAIGLVFGVASVMASLSIADGARDAAIREFGDLGATNILIRDQSPAGTAPVIGLADLEPIRAAVPSLTSVAATRLITTVAGSEDRRVDGAVIAGVTPEWPDITHTQLTAGRWPTDREFREARRVAVVGSGLSTELFRAASPIGRRVLAGGAWFEIIGIAASRGASGAITLFDLDRAVLTPFGAMEATQGRGDAIDRARELIVQVASSDAVMPAAAIVNAAMARLHPAVTYQVVVPKELLRARLAARRTANWLLFAIGGIALVISGIGIMNIMLANVLERTPEIGVRRAFGARQPDILAQFAVESALLCAGGGVIGVPLGALMAGAAAWAGGWPISISATSIVLALGLATAVGVGFGLYPARRAAAIQPVDALRA